MMTNGGPPPGRRSAASRRPASQVPPSSIRASGKLSSAAPSRERTSGARRSSRATVIARQATTILTTFLRTGARMERYVTEALPLISEDGRTYVFKIRPGIYFADDPVFKGERRELTVTVQEQGRTRAR